MPGTIQPAARSPAATRRTSAVRTESGALVTRAWMRASGPVEQPVPAERARAAAGILGRLHRGAGVVVQQGGGGQQQLRFRQVHLPMLLLEDDEGGFRRDPCLPHEPDRQQQLGAVGQHRAKLGEPVPPVPLLGQVEVLQRGRDVPALSPHVGEIVLDQDTGQRQVVVLAEPAGGGEVGLGMTERAPASVDQPAIGQCPRLPLGIADPTEHGQRPAQVLQRLVQPPELLEYGRPLRQRASGLHSSRTSRAARICCSA